MSVQFSYIALQFRKPNIRFIHFILLSYYTLKSASLGLSYTLSLVFSVSFHGVYELQHSPNLTPFSAVGDSHPENLLPQKQKNDAKK